MITAVVAAIAITQREARLEKERQQADAEAAAKKSIVIVGGGLVGVIAACIFRQHGFSVTLLEQLDEDEVPETAGTVTLTATAVRLVSRIGEKVREAVEEVASGAEELHYRSHRRGKLLQTAYLSPITSTSFRPLHGCWSDFYDLFLDLADELDADIRFGAKVIAYKDSPEDLDGPLPNGRPYALTEAGEKFYGDVIVAADGIDSLARKHVLAQLGVEDTKLDTGYSVFSGTVDGQDLLEDNVTKGLVKDGDRGDVWIGEDRFLLAYTVDDGEEWLWELFRPDSVSRSSAEGYQKPASAASAAELIKNWDPAVVAAVRKSNAAWDRRLTTIPTVPKWVSPKTRKVVLLGDAAHPFPPASSLALSETLDSVASLSVCLKKAASVPLALEIYSRLRQPRINTALAAAEEKTKEWREKKEYGEKLDLSDLTWLEGNIGTEENLFGEQVYFDAEKDADKRFEEVIEALTRELLGRQQAMMQAQAEAQAKAEAEARQKMEEEEERRRKEEEDEGSYEDDEEDDEEEDEEGEEYNQTGQATSSGAEEAADAKSSDDSNSNETEEKDKSQAESRDSSLEEQNSSPTAGDTETKETSEPSNSDVTSPSSPARSTSLRKETASPAETEASDKDHEEPDTEKPQSNLEVRSGR